MIDSKQDEAVKLEDRCKDGSSRRARSEAHTRHGHTKGHNYSPTYHSWQAMLARTRYIERDVQAKHIGRGISVCARWQDFENFLADMGERPNGTTLDRLDNDADYGPDNCRWATPVEQARNRRNAKLLLDVLARIKGDTVVAELGDPAAPVLVRDPGCDRQLFVVMPFRV